LGKPSGAFGPLQAIAEKTKPVEVTGKALWEKLSVHLLNGLPFLLGNKSRHKDFLLPEGRLASFLRKTLEKVHPRWED
jgi:hypothetical protein